MGGGTAESLRGSYVSPCKALLELPRGIMSTETVFVVGCPDDSDMPTFD